MNNTEPVKTTLINLPKLIPAILPFIELLFNLRKAIQHKRTKAKKARLQNSKYYPLFFITIVLPFWISYFILIIILSISLIILVTGLLNLHDNDFLSKLFTLSVVNVIAYGLLAFSVHLNVIPLLMVICLKIFRSDKRSPGLINAHWFLDDSPFYPMSLDETSVDRLANSILEDIRSHGRNAIKFKAPFPCSRNNNTKANYLLFLCSIEDCVHIYDNKDTSILNECYKYLENCSCLGEDVFGLRNLVELHSENKDFYKYLLGLKESFQSPDDQKGSLPDKPSYHQDINSTFNQLIKNYNGEGIRMACNVIGQYSPKALSKNLKCFKRMKRDSIRGLYYKLSRRMNIWPKFSKYPFKYFFNNGIAILLLNSHCVNPDKSLEEIKKDRYFRKLIYKAESEVVKVVFNRLKNNMGSGVVEEINQFFKANFNLNLEEASLWQITDIIDVWLFNHARSYCLVDNGKDQCSLKQWGSCYCGNEYPMWKLNTNKDIIKVGE